MHRAFLGGFLFLALVLVFFVRLAPAHASGGYLSGYAWSSNVGWISFNGTGGGGSYGVTISSTDNQTLSGYAWSDGIGWINFGSNACGPQAKIVSGTLQGWAQAIGADGNGWDGCISLTSSNGGGGAYGPTLPGNANTSGVFSGYAWGSDVVGWIDFGADAPSSGVQATFSNIGTSFNPNFTVSPSRVQKSTDTAYLTWDASAQMASCSGVTVTAGSASVGGNTAVLKAAGTQVSVTNVTTNATFTLTCTDAQSNIYTATASLSLVPIFKEI